MRSQTGFIPENLFIIGDSSRWEHFLQCMDAVNLSHDKDPDDTETPVLDPTRLSMLMQLQDDDDHSTVRAIVDQFLLDVAEQIDRIEHAIASKNFPLVASAAHTIKGNAATFGLYQVERIAKNLEMLAKGSGHEDPVVVVQIPARSILHRQIRINRPPSPRNKL